MDEESLDAEQEIHRVYRALETVRDGVSLLDADGEFIYLNEAYADIFGYDPDEMVGVHWETLGIEENPDYFYDEILPELLDEGQWDGTTRCVRSDGTTFRAQHSLTYTDDDEIICVLNDLSERGNRIRNLRDVQAQLDATTTATSIGVWSWDIADDRIIADRSLAELFGVDPNAAHRGIAPDAVMPNIHSDDQMRVEQTIADAIKSGTDFQVEFRIHSGIDGETRWLTAHGNVETDEHGESAHLFGAISDNTAQKQVSEELQWTEEQLRLALQAGELGAWELDLQTKNSPARTPQHDQIFGYDEPLDEWSFERFLDHVHPDDREMVTQSFENSRQTGETWDFQCRIVQADDELRWISAQGEFYYDDEGDPLRAIGVVQDITDRTERERELQRVERQFEATFNNPVSFVGLLDPDGTIRRINENALEFADIDEAAVRGKKFWETPWFAHSADVRADLREGITRAANGEYVRAEIPHQSPDGETIIMDSMLEPVRDDDGEVVAIVPSGHDITERKERETELELFRNLIDRSNDAVFVIDPATSQLIDVNETACQRLGYKRADLLELTVLNIEANLSDQAAWQAHAEEVRTEGSQTFEGEHERADGTTIPVEVNVTYISLDREYMCAIARDVTERREHERELRERNERLKRFASMLAHELRNPVTIGQIYSQQLPAEAESDAVDYITEAFDRIENMIDVMLVLTRGHDAIGEQTSVPLVDVAQEAWDEVETANATLETEIDQTIQADKTYIRHLFRNLFENAVEHGGADITVTFGELPTGFYVADDGVGISSDEQDAVFEAGYTTASDNGGTGLGLAFVQELAGVYGWECAVTESAAGGARFKFTNIY